MKKLLLGTTLAGILVQSLHAGGIWSLESKWIDLSKVGLEKSTPVYGIDFSYEKDIGERGSFYLYGDFSFLFGKSDVKSSSKSIDYAEYSLGLGPMYKFGNGIGIFAIPRIGFVGYSDSWGSNKGSDGYLLEGTAGVSFDYKRLNIKAFASFGKRWIESLSYDSDSYGLKIGWRF
jgi:hypothetical protein